MKRIRYAVRALLVTDDRKILLMRMAIPGANRWVWITPGGALAKAETAEAALRRELKEEVGLESFDIGPEVWRRRHVLVWAGEEIDQRERFFWVQIPQFQPATDGMPSVEERELIDRCQWWAAEEILRSKEEFAPRRLGSLLQSLIEAGAPAHPLEVGV